MLWFNLFENYLTKISTNRLGRYMNTPLTRRNYVVKNNLGLSDYYLQFKYTECLNALFLQKNQICITNTQLPTKQTNSQSANKTLCRSMIVLQKDIIGDEQKNKLTLFVELGRSYFCFITLKATMMLKLSDLRQGQRHLVIIKL